MLDKLIRDGYFYARPWNRGQAFMFRKNVPRLIFVFSNEFDNSFSRVAKQYSGVSEYKFKDFDFELVSFPTTMSGNKLAFYVDAGSKLNSSQQPPDPHSLRLFRDENLKTSVEEYLGSIGLTGEEYSTSLEYLYDSWLGPIRYPDLQRITELTLRGSELRDNSKKIDWTIPIPTKLVLNGQTTLENGYLNWENKRLGGILEDRDLGMEDLDLNGFYSPLADCSAENLLTQEQKELIKQGRFAELGYTIESITTSRKAQKDRITSIDYTMAKTIGYYRLMDSMAKTTDPTNVYMFVMDSNAPHPVHDDSTDPTHLFPYNDIGMFKDMLKIELPEDWQSTINNAIDATGTNKKNLWDDCHTYKTKVSEPKWDFGTLVVSNLQWILSNKDGMRNPIPYQNKYSTTTSKWVSAIPTVFGLENPYTSNHTIIAKRTYDIDTFLNDAKNEK